MTAIGLPSHGMKKQYTVRRPRANDLLLQLCRHLI